MEEHASEGFLCWWLAASLSAACYFHGDLMLQARTSLSSLVRALHITASMAMAALSAATLAPGRVDVALACAGDAPNARRCLMTFGVVFCGCLLSLTLETLRGGCASRPFVLRLAQVVLVVLFAQVVAHRGDLLCTEWERRNLAAPSNRTAFSTVYLWSAVAFALCNRIEASVDLASDESDDEAPDDDEDPGHKPGSPVAETDLEGNWGAVKAAFAFAEDAARPAKGDKCR